MPLITHPDGGKLLRTATGLAGHAACCCGFECPECEWYRECFSGKEAHVRIEQIAAGDVCSEAECDEFNTTYIVPLADNTVGAYCGSDGDFEDLISFACNAVGVAVDIGVLTGGVNAFVEVNWGIPGPTGDNLTWHDTGCAIAEDLCAGIEVELTLTTSNPNFCTHSTAKCFLQILPP